MNDKKKPRRRGQVIPLGNGKFKLRVPVSASGKRSYHNETLYSSTATKAGKRVTKLLAEIDSGAFLEPSRKTVKDFFETEWLPQKIRDGVRPTTHHDYQKSLRQLIFPRLGSARLCDLKPKTVQDLYNGWRDEGYSAATMRLARTVWLMGLRRAVVWGYLKSNPAEHITLPASTAPPAEHRSLSSAEAIAFIEAASTEVRDAPYLFQLVAGLRPEEMAGLRRTDVELLREANGEGWKERGVAHIRQVAVLISGKGWKFLDPKTASGRRDAYFPAHVHHALVAYFERMPAGKYDLCFPSTKGDPFCPKTYARGLRKVVKRAGIKWHVMPYTLRYSFATLALLAGELDKTVSAQMGHARVNFTKDVYQKSLPEMGARLSDRLENLFFSSGRTPLAHSEVEGSM
jgi:integrase